MDHAICLYTIRCYNPDSEKKSNSRYHFLNSIGSQDLFVMLREFIKNKTDFIKLDEKKQAYRFGGVSIDEGNRIISGWMHYGYYGIESDIVNLENNQVEFEKKENNADIGKHFFMFWIPKSETGIAIFHTVRSDGIKSVFQKEFSPYMQRYIPRTLQIMPLSNEKALQEWSNATAKTITAVRLSRNTDLANIPTSIGDVHTSYVIKPRKKSGLGKLKNFVTIGSPENNLIQELDQQSDDVRVVVQMGDKHRTFKLGSRYRHSLCEIELPDTIKMVGGSPELSSIRAWVMEVLSEYKEKIYNLD